MNAPTTKLSSLTVESADLGFVYNGETKTVQLYSGSHYQTAGTYQEGDSVLSVSDSIVRGDIRGTSWVGPTSGNTSGYTVTAGNSTVTVTDTVMNGYTKGVSTWNGRIFGGGILQYTSDSSLTIASTHVTASGITGLDTEQGSGEVTHNPGVRIFGGGQVYDDGSAKNNTLTVKESFVELTGTNSEVLYRVPTETRTIQLCSARRKFMFLMQPSQTGCLAATRSIGLVRVESRAIRLSRWMVLPR